MTVLSKHNNYIVAGMEGPMLARLVLTPSKLASLSGGLRQIAAASKNVLGQVKRHTIISDVSLLSSY